MEKRRREKVNSDTIYRALVGQIYSHALCKGDRLPSLQNLCQTYGGAYNTTRAAVQRLWKNGFISKEERKASRIVFDLDDPATRAQVFLYAVEQKQVILDIHMAKALVFPSLALASAKELTDGYLDDLATQLEAAGDLTGMVAVSRFLQLAQSVLCQLGNEVLNSYIGQTDLVAVLPYGYLKNSGMDGLYGDILASYRSLCRMIRQKDREGIGRLLEEAYRMGLPWCSQIFAWMEQEAGALPLAVKAVPYQRRHGDLAMSTNILMRIITGHWQEGELLPAEAQLCQEYACSKRRLRGALAYLNEMRVVSTVNGVGSTVTYGADPGQLATVSRTVAIDHAQGAFEALQLLVFPIGDVAAYALAHTNLRHTLHTTVKHRSLARESFSPLLFFNCVVDALRSDALDRLYAQIKQKLIWGIYLFQPPQASLLMEYNEKLGTQILGSLDNPQRFGELMMEMCLVLMDMCAQSCVRLGLPFPRLSKKFF